MPRKLKTYRTTAGFFDLAVAAPSMKAALEAWGAGANLFQQGFPSVTRDPAIVKATTAKPGVVLRRPVGTTGPFREHAELPADLPAKSPPRKVKPTPNVAEVRRLVRNERLAERERERRRTAIAAAEAALAEARKAHDARQSTIDADRAALEHRTKAKAEWWRDERERLEAALRKIRASGLRVV